jgi:hypothetical protein
VDATAMGVEENEAPPRLLEERSNWKRNKLKAHQTLEEKREAYVLKKVHEFLDEENMKREEG